MTAILSLGMGYLLGCLSPSAWLSKRKNIDLTQTGTKNLGATNTAYVLGKSAGMFVMVVDMLKSFLSFRLARVLFPQLRIAGLLAGIGAILGHCFPVFRNFQGGKGLAAFSGLVLAYNIRFFLVILFPGIALMLLLNTGVAAVLYGCFLFPVLVWLAGGSLPECNAALSASALIVLTHWTNIKRALARKDVVKTREFFEKVFGDK